MEIKNKKQKKIKKIFIVPYSHIDWVWRNNRKYFVHRNRQVIFSALDFLDKEKSYYWEGIHKLHTIEDFWQKYPEFRKKLKKYVQEGRIDLTGSTIVTPIPPFYEEEVMIRNITYGKKYYKEMFGIVNDSTLYFADVPMLFAQLPQFAKKFGFKYYIVERPNQALTSKKIPREFIWEAPDGSKILSARAFYAVGFPGGGNHTVLSPGVFEKAVKETEKRLKYIAGLCLTPIICLPDAADWAFPTLNLPEFVSFWNNKFNEPKLSISSHSQYFKALEKYREKLPSFKGNLDPISWNGVYGTNGEKANINLRKIVNKILMAERLMSFQSLFFNITYPEKDFFSTWKKIILLYAHGGYHGSYLFPDDYYSAEQLIKKSNKEIDKLDSSFIKLFTKNGKKLFAFNPLSWKRKEWVEKGNEAFWVEAPSLGYSFVNQKKLKLDLKFENECLENKYCQLVFDKGKLISIIDKKAGKNALNERNKYSGVEVLIDEGDLALLTANFFKTYRINYKNEIKLLEDKSYKKIIGLEADFRGNTIIQEITLYANKKEIYIKTEIRNKEPNLRYRLCLFTAFSKKANLFADDLFIIEKKDLAKEPIVGLPRSNPEASVFESPLETLHKKGKGENKGVFYGLRFASLESINSGIALFNKGTFGYKIEDNILSNILLRSPDVEKLDQYKICPHLLGKGRFVFENVIYPYQGNERIEVFKKSLEFNSPLLTIPERNPKFSMAQVSLLQINSDNIILSAFYKEKDYFHLHLYEVEGKDTMTEFEFLKPIEKAIETNFLGDSIIHLKIKDKKCFLRFKPFQIKKIEIKFKQ